MFVWENLDALQAFVWHEADGDFCFIGLDYNQPAGCWWKRSAVILLNPDVPKGQHKRILDVQTIREWELGEFPDLAI